MKICDLHTHSVYSDGTCTPEQIIDLAKARGLSCVALCDHNTVAGLPEFLRAAEARGVEAVAGAEFSVDYNGKELHLLGFFIPEDQLERVSLLMKAANDRKRQSNIDLIKTLNALGYELDFDAIASQTPNGHVNRAHIAAALTEKGYTESISHAFSTLLSPRAGYYKEPKRYSVFEVIAFVRSMGAVPVLAHPFLNLKREELEVFLPKAKEKGLVGMECYYSLYDEKTTLESLELAQKFGFLCSGGSDFHGQNKPDIALGTGKGNLKIPYALLEALRTAR